MKQKRFTTEFEEEAVRLLRTSGPTKREIGEDLGVSLSTLTRWLSQGRDREMGEPDRRSEGEDAAAKAPIQTGDG
jgi:transposase